MTLDAAELAAALEVAERRAAWWRALYIDDEGTNPEQLQRLDEEADRAALDPPRS